MPSFVDSRKRLDRAMEHAKALDRQWTALINPESYDIVIKMNGDWTEGVAKVVPIRPLPKNDLALQFGELFYQLRSALDAVIYQTMVASGGFSSPTDENRIEFPIYTTPEQFKRNPINKAPFPVKLRDWLESIQPYNIAKAPNPKIVQALQLLHDCARKDRHRRLHVVAAYPTSMHTQFLVTHPGRVTSAQQIPANFLEGECEFLTFKFAGATPETNITIKLNTDTMIEIAIEEIPSASSVELGKKIDWVFHSVKTTVEHFEKELGWS